jgi:hypothetical protein
MGAVLCQPDFDEEHREAVLRDSESGACEFDKNISGLRPRPIEFIDGKCTSNELSWHESNARLDQ